MAFNKRDAAPSSVARLITGVGQGPGAVALAPADAIETRPLEAPGMNNTKAGLNEVLQMCQTVEKLIATIFTAREQKKGERNKWRGKARRLLRKISESI